MPYDEKTSQKFDWLNRFITPKTCHFLCVVVGRIYLFELWTMLGRIFQVFSVVYRVAINGNQVEGTPLPSNPDLEIKVDVWEKVGKFGGKLAGWGKRWQVCENSWQVRKKLAGWEPTCHTNFSVKAQWEKS